MLDTDTRLQRARVQLCLKQPYLASALMRFPLVETSVVKDIATDGYHFFWNRTYVESINDQQLRGALAHVLMHILTQSVGRRQGRRMDLWRQATDYAINPVLKAFGFKLPDDALFDLRFSRLTAEEIYETLYKEASNGQKTSPKKQQGTSNVAKDISQQCRQKDQPSSNDTGQAGVVPALSDDLVDPNSLEGLRCRAFTPNAPDQEEIRETAESLFLETKTKLQEAGKLPGAFSQLFEASNRSSVNWQALLADWLYDTLKDDWSTWPPAKKHIARGLYLPSVGHPAPIRLVMLIDTSGSMSDEMLQRIFAEVRGFRDTFPTAFTIVQADVQVTRVDDYEPYEDFDETAIKLCGRGGTNFKPCYRWVQKHRSDEPVAIIHATDGWGTFPTECDHPVIFLVPREVAKACPNLPQFPVWGHRVVV